MLKPRPLNSARTWRGRRIRSPPDGDDVAHPRVYRCPEKIDHPRRPSKPPGRAERCRLHRPLPPRSGSARAATGVFFSAAEIPRFDTEEDLHHAIFTGELELLQALALDLFVGGQMLLAVQTGKLTLEILVLQVMLAEFNVPVDQRPYSTPRLLSLRNLLKPLAARLPYRRTIDGPKGPRFSCRRDGFCLSTWLREPSRRARTISASEARAYCGRPTRGRGRRRGEQSAPRRHRRTARRCSSNGNASARPPSGSSSCSR